jgi:hypothetical protein
MKLRLQDITAESLSAGRTQGMNRNTFGTFFNILEKVVTENSLSGTHGNVSKVNRNGTQVNNPDTVIIGKGPK